MSCFIPHNLFSCSNVASLSSTRTFKYQVGLHC
jgi:hypothetical protein